MTIRFFSFICFFFFMLKVTGQNLVPNPSFEEYENGCPENLNDLPAGWSAWRESPNSFSSCIEPETLLDSLGWAPWNGFGYQEPYDGSAYVGMYVVDTDDWVSTIPNDFREFIGCELNEQLVIGQEYFVSFKASAAFGNYYYPTWASSHLGVFFSNQSYNWLDDPLDIPNQAQVFTSGLLSDTSSWVIISGSFIADQEYSHMGIGTFFEFEYVDTLNFFPGLVGVGGYAYVDDICVSTTENCSGSNIFERTNSSKVKIYPNPGKGLFRIESPKTFNKVEVYNHSGHLIDVITLDMEQFFDVSHLQEGVYIGLFISPGTTRREKLVIVN